MKPHSRWPQIKDIFAAAMELPPDRRTAFLLSMCPAGDPEVLREVRSLLQFESGARGFLSGPIPDAQDLKTASPALLATGDIVAGRYRITRLLGIGGMCGGVYEAWDRELKIAIALKVICDPAEFLAARLVTHPNVCRVFDSALDGAIRYMTMELLEGETLEQRLSRKGPLNDAERDAFVHQVRSALAAAHAAGVLHRDLKPGNVFLTRGTHGRAVLTDFGLARSGAAAATGSRQWIGTLPYMAPELFAGRPSSAASDVYSLGVLICEASTGKLPCDGAIVPAPWGRFVRQCLHLNPTKRPVLQRRSVMG